VGEGEAPRWLFRALNLILRPGQCTGVVGRNGTGKTTLLRLCLGERSPDHGSVSVGRRVVFNYFDQARAQLIGTGTVLSEIADEGETVRFGDRVLGARSYLRRFLFTEERIREPVNRLSGGERARLLLAKVLKRGGNLLVLDEPTNDLDLPSLRLLEEALVDFAGSVLVVSHDRYFLDRICDQIVAFEPEGVVVQPGNYAYYREKRAEREQRARAASASISPPGQPAGTCLRPSTTSAQAHFKEQREIEGIEAAILSAESRVHDAERTLNDPSFYATRAADAPAVIAELDAARAEVARLYQRWEELDAVGKR
jgi:ABC transport system ATP-binding/permease protein